ncbi:glutathione S-transferase family protein [Pseudoxanthomonas winnipegensis]|uniref:glutathione S-transferase family protein n=1 Tax=Pseudoxanthomonas winnipegensis TaxID=2480810 RepID=UPI00103B43ED|nr:glutathione S-transferase N-terminal domain-containing protein [Pseudoxanthomonas winnipegensis]TBV75855.1 glutathione S-transferase family protein [Pseudoxanthomonas winnipegensis]
MIEVYAFATPNSVKVPIALEELGLDYTLQAVNVKQGAQRQDAFRALNPNAKVPVLVQADAIGQQQVLTESAAILVHLAETSGQLLPTEPQARARVFEQLFFHASAVSPAFGNAGYFRTLATEPQPLALQRFADEARRVTALLDGLLTERIWVAGDTYSIADIAHFGWFWRRAFAGVALEDFPHLQRWYAAIEARPAVQRAIARVNALVPSP